MIAIQASRGNASISLAMVINHIWTCFTMLGLGLGLGRWIDLEEGLLQFQIGTVDEDATAVKMLTSQLFKREMDQQIISDGRDILGYVRGLYVFMLGQQIRKMGKLGRAVSVFALSKSQCRWVAHTSTTAP